MEGNKSNIKTQLFIWNEGRELGVRDCAAGGWVSELNARYISLQKAITFASAFIAHYSQRPTSLIVVR